MLIMKKNKLNNDFKNRSLSKDQILLKKILSPLEFRCDLLIEHLHKIQDHFGYLSEKNLSFLAEFLNLSKVEYMDSSGISVLIESKKLSEKKNTKFELVEVSKPVEKVLAMARKFL